MSTALHLDVLPSLNILILRNLAPGFALLLAICLFVVSKSFIRIGRSPHHVPGCRKLSGPSRSAYEDQYDSKHRIEEGLTPRVQGLFVYPIKSCQGVEVDEIEVQENGLKHDRLFMFTQQITKDNQTEWQFMTLRNFPLLAHVHIEVWEPDPAAQDYSEGAEFVQSEGCLEVSFPHIVHAGISNVSRLQALLCNLPDILSQRTMTPIVRRSFRIPHSPSSSQITKLALSKDAVKLFGGWPSGIDMGSCIDGVILEELRTFLGVSNPLTIFRKDPNVPRDVHGNADDIHALGYRPHTNFADEFPINILNIASVQDVATLLPQGFGRLSAARFRTNILITGTPAYAEETWKRIHLSPSTLAQTTSSSPLLFHITNRTTRCALPNVDPHQQNPCKPNVVKLGGIHYNEPAKTLRAYRAVDKGAPGKPCLGMMVVPDGSAIGRKLKAGIMIEVLQKGEHILKD